MPRSAYAPTEIEIRNVLRVTTARVGEVSRALEQADGVFERAVRILEDRARERSLTPRRRARRSSPWQ